MSSLSGLFPKSDPLAGMTREETGEEIGEELKLPAAEPSVGADPHAAAAPEDVESPTSALLDICRIWIRRYIVVTEEQAVVLAAWLLHTYTFGAAETTPYIHITAPERECGKSRLMEVLAEPAANPLCSGGMTAAALVRGIAQLKPTVFLDEMDSLQAGNKEFAETLRGILNVGFRAGGTFYKVNAKTHKLESFGVYGPKCFAGIGHLPDTVASRSIVIEMRRKLPGESVEPFRQRVVKQAVTPIKAELEAWAAGGAVDELLRIVPDPIPGLGDRQNDISEPLMAIAMLAGGTWPGRVAHSLKTIFTATRVDGASDGAILLADIRTVFDERQVDVISSKELASCLCDVEGRPWAEMSMGRGMTPNLLARQLKGFKLAPQTIRIGSETMKGYRRSSFEELWLRYCPRRYASVTDAQHASNPHEYSSVTDVTVASPTRSRSEVRI
jgi:hypothetical protein